PSCASRKRSVRNSWSSPIGALRRCTLPHCHDLTGHRIERETRTRPVAELSTVFRSEWLGGESREAEGYRVGVIVDGGTERMFNQVVINKRRRRAHPGEEYWASCCNRGVHLGCECVVVALAGLEA